MSPDGKLAVTAVEDGSIKVWDLASQRVLWSIDLGLELARSVHFISGGRELVGGFGRTAHIWRVSARRQPKWCRYHVHLAIPYHQIAVGEG